MADPNEAGDMGGWVIDPNNPNRATYTDEYGTVYEAFREPEPEEPLRRSGWERMKDAFTQASLEGFGGQVAQKWYDWTDATKDDLKKRFPGKTEDWYEDQSDKVVSLARRGVIEELARRQEEDPNWRPDDTFLGNVLAIDRWGPWLTGQVLGSAGPESFVNPGGSAGARILGQAGMGAASDALYQGLNVSQGVKDEFDETQVLMNAATSAGLQTAFEIPSFVRNLFKERGVDTTPSADPRTPEPDLSEVAPVRMTPEQEAQYQQLLENGSLDQILGFFSDKPGMAVDPQKMAEWVALRDSGQSVSPVVTYDGRVDPSEAALADEANRFLASRPSTDEMIEAAGLSGKSSPGLSLEERLAQEANSFVAARGGEADTRAPVVPEQVEAVDAPIEDIEARLADEANAFISSRGNESDSLAPVSAPQKIAEAIKPKVDTSTAPKVSFDKGITRAEKAADAINEIAKDWQNPPKFIVVNSLNDLDDVDLRNSIDPDAIGVTTPDGDVIINMENVDSPETLSAVTFHEALGHHGLTQKFGEDLDSFLNDLYFESKGEFSKKVDEWVRKNPDVYTGPDQTIRAAEEVLAEMSEKGQISRSILDKIKDFLKNLGREMGLSLKYSDREIRSILAMAHDAVINGYGRDVPSNGFRYMRRKDGQRENIGAINPNKISTVHDIDKYLEELASVNPSRKTTWEETEAEALARGLTPSRIAKRRGADGLASYLRAANIALAEQLDKVAKLDQKMVDEGYSHALHEQLLEELARLKAVHARVNYDNSEVGRALNILKMVSTTKGKTQNITEALEKFGNEVLADPEQFMKYMMLVRQEISSGNTKGATKLVRDVFRPNAEDFIFRAWYNMLLSSPSTHVANFLGTGGNFVVDLLENTGASILGQGKRFSNADRIRGREVAYRVWGALKALTDAGTWTRTRESLNTGMTGNAPNSKAGASNVYTGDDAAVGFVSGFLESPTRLLAGSDEWWRNVLQLSNIYGLAVRNAGNKGLKGKAFWNEVQNLIDNPTKEMIDATNDYTKVLQFLDKPSAIAESLIKLQTPGVDSTVPGRIARGALRVAVPFVRTPDALIRTSIRRSGFLGAAERENINGWKAGGAERDKVKARLFMGSFLSFWIASQAYKGDITGEGPSEYRKKMEWLGSHQENSIKVGDTWYSLQGLEPVSTNITGIATLVERLKNGEISSDDYSKSAISLVQGIASVLTNNSYLESFANLLEVSSGDPNVAEAALTNFIAGLASSATTPAILRSYTQATDTAIRDTTGDGSMSDRIIGRIMSAVPGLSEQLPQRFDVYGRPRSRDKAGPDMASRVSTRMEEDDPVIQELADLAEKTDKVLVGAPGKSGIKVNGVKRRLTAEEYQQYQWLSGYWIVESIRQEMQYPEWYEMTDDEKIEIIKDIVSDMRANARDYLFDPDDEE